MLEARSSIISAFWCSANSARPPHCLTERARGKTGAIFRRHRDFENMIEFDKASGVHVLANNVSFGSNDVLVVVAIALMFQEIDT